MDLDVFKWIHQNAVCFLYHKYDYFFKLHFSRLLLIEDNLNKEILRD